MSQTSPVAAGLRRRVGHGLGCFRRRGKPCRAVPSRLAWSCRNTPASPNGASVCIKIPCRQCTQYLYVTDDADTVKGKLKSGQPVNSEDSIALFAHGLVEDRPYDSFGASFSYNKIS
jgi:hypothetical protein